MLAVLSSRWWILPLALVVFVLFAKAHGRQVRLERTAHGYDSVVFGGANPPFVEALWKKDRVRYWTTAGLAAGGALLVALLLRARGIDLQGGAPALAWLVAIAPMLVAFFVAGLSSLGRLLASGRAGDVDAALVRASLLGSVGWWSAALAGAALLAPLVLRRT